MACASERNGTQGGRLIRPAGPDAVPSDGPVELSLEELQRFAERLVKEARQRVAELETRAGRIEDDLAARAEEAERDLLLRRESAATELEEVRRSRLAEREEARRAAEERGLAEGRARGEVEGREEGYGKGFSEGYAEGLRKGQREAEESGRARLAEECAPAAAALSAILKEIEACRRGLRREAREELLPLALEVARKVVKREVRECPEVVLQNVRKAIDLAFRRTALTVQVHPDDLALLESHSPAVLGCFAGLGDVLLRAAGDVGRGGCRVVSGSGVVDLRIEAQLEVIERALSGRLLEEEPEERAPVEDRGEGGRA